mgnify:CR=1 FL=1
MNIWRYIKKQWKLNTLVVTLDIINSLCVTLFSVGIADVLTAIVQHDVVRVVNWFIVLIIISIVWAVQYFLHDRVYALAVQRMDMDIRQDISLLLEGVNYNYFHSQSSSVYVSWLTNDISTINDYGFDCLELAITQALMVLMRRLLH